MKIFEKQAELISYLKKNYEEKSIGFVPTMGALHNGHLSLIDRALRECDIVICSIFVNPTQFNQASDFDNYPVTHQADISQLKNAGCTILFLPSSKEEVYKNEKPFSVHLGEIANVLEGKYRKGHFDGVMRVVKLLFEITSPTKAYFGLKDFQQYLVIKTMVKQLAIPVDIVGCDIIREPDGLAMSSRNTRLTPEQREEALVLKLALDHAKNNYSNISTQQLKKDCLAILNTKSNPEYFEICDAATLLPVEANSNTEHIRAFVAAIVGDVRLIDNIEIY